MQDTIPWPLGDIIPDTATGIDMKAIEDITRKVIVDNAYNGNAFAFMVLHKGIPVSEAYKPDFDKNTRFLSWSMAKSFTNALIGILVRQGKIDINQPAGIEEWKGDERSKISVNDLMQMQSGLDWNEDYGNRSDVTLMLHCESDMAHYAIDSFWIPSCGIITGIILPEQPILSVISSGSNLLMIIRYYSFAHEELFNKTGMADAIFEVDPAGTSHRIIISVCNCEGLCTVCIIIPE